MRIVQAQIQCTPSHGAIGGLSPALRWLRCCGGIKLRLTPLRPRSCEAAVVRKRNRIPEASNSDVIYSSASVAGRPVRGATTGTEGELVHQARELLASFVQTMDDLITELSGGLALHNSSRVQKVKACAQFESGQLVVALNSWKRVGVHSEVN